MSDVRFVLVHEPAGIAPYAAGLRRLEQGIRYPLGDGADHFVIDHGAEYFPFFSALGEARFLLMLRGDEVVGSIAGVVRPVLEAGRPVQALYLCDLKLAAAERGRGHSRRLLWRGLVELLRTPALRRCRLIYGASMRGERGDVMRSARGLHPFRIGRPGARFRLYFAAPERLAALDVARAPPPPTSPGLELGPAPGAPLTAPGLLSTAGRKDLRLVSSGEPWPLVHLPLGPSSWGGSWGAYLRACGAALVARGRPAVACFSLDERLADHAGWLAAQGVDAGASCALHSLRLPPRARRTAWAHLPTSEI